MYLHMCVYIYIYIYTCKGPKMALFQVTGPFLWGGGRPKRRSVALFQASELLWIVNYCILPRSILKSFAKSRLKHHASSQSWMSCNYPHPEVVSRLNHDLHLGVSTNGGSPKWMVYLVENP